MTVCSRGLGYALDPLQTTFTRSVYVCTVYIGTNVYTVNKSSVYVFFDCTQYTVHTS